MSGGSSTDPIADGTYDVRVGYPDAVDPSAAATVTVDRVTQAPQLVAPATGDRIDGRALQVSYVLPEDAQPGSVTITVEQRVP